MLHQRAQDGRGREAAERADEGKIVGAGAPLPAAVTGGDAGGFVEQMRKLGEHEFLKFWSCSPHERSDMQVYPGIASLTRATLLCARLV